VTAGLVDGAKFQTVDMVDRLGKGVGRTAEGLGLLGQDKFSLVGVENMVVAGLFNTTFKALVNIDLSFIDNPLTQCVNLVIERYLTAIPEWVIEDMLKDGVFDSLKNLDEYRVLSAARKGISELSNIEEVKKTKGAIRDGSRQFISKQVGKALTAKTIAAISSLIASKIAKDIMSDPRNTRVVKRHLAVIRKGINSTKGNLGNILLTLLKTQGLLGVVAKASRQLHSDCPITWGIMRNKMQGIDMIFFLMQPILQEYVDRLNLLKKQPLVFVKVIGALIRDRETNSLLRPYMA